MRDMRTSFKVRKSKEMMDGLTSLGTIIGSIFLLSGAAEKSNVKKGPDLTIDSRGVVKVLNQGA